MGSYEEAKTVCDLIKSKVPYEPRIGIVCGSGLGKLGEIVQNKIIIKYSEIEQFPKSTVVGHAGNLIFGDLGGKKVMVMQGRFHPYEGYEMSHVTLPIRVMKLVGCQYVFLTNAAGGLHPNYAVGDIIFLRDHISFPGLSGVNPLVGKNDERFGTRFPSLQNVYDCTLRTMAKRIAKEMGIQNITHEGVYVAVMGPTYETPAEARMLRILGADVVGMSTAHETIVAAHAGLKVFAMSLVTNMEIIEEDREEITDHEEVLRTSAIRAETMTDLVTRLITAIPV